MICFNNGCMADYEASDALIGIMKKGQGLVVQGINGAGQAISLVLPLNDFAKAYDGPPTDPKVFEEQQKKLQEELQRRAEEARKKLEGQPEVGVGAVSWCRQKPSYWQATVRSGPRAAVGMARKGTDHVQVDRVCVGSVRPPAHLRSVDWRACRRRDGSEFLRRGKEGQRRRRRSEAKERASSPRRNSRRKRRN